MGEIPLSSKDRKNMTEEIISPLFFEKTLIKFLFHDNDVRDKILPFLNEDIFDSFETKEIVKTISKFLFDNNKFPTIPEIKLEITNKESFDCLKECLDIDISEYDHSYILGKIEDFFKKKMIYNELITAANYLKNDKMESLTDISDKIRDKLSFSFDTSVGSNTFSDKGKEDFWEYLHKKDKVIPSGIPYFDFTIEGGFCEKTLSLFMAQSGLGKSLILCSLGANFLLQNYNVLYITLEMSEKKIERRILANLFDIEVNKFKKISKEEYSKKFDKYISRLKNKLIIKEFPAKSINANRIRNLLKELKNKCKFVPDIICLDYLGLLCLNNNKKDSGSYELLKEISEEVRSVSQEYLTPILSAIQTNRDGFGASILDLKNVADSIGIIATADIVIGVTQPEEFQDLGKYCWQFLKNRDGINGNQIVVGVDKGKMKIFSDPDQEKEFEKIFKDNKNSVKDAVSDISNNIKSNKKQKLSEITNVKF